jgi:regulator of protease activity HflC (stomatin/prohibitin superfamily)
VIERFGKFDRVVDAGLHFLIPGIERVSYIHSLKEQTIPIAQQMAITMDNVYISIDGVLYLQIVDPIKASYGVTNIYYAMTQLAQTTMRSELGKITLDKTFAERESLNANIVESINAAAEPWGVKCLRYEIRDITPPESVRNAMELQAEAERRKRATILDSEGAKQSDINVADGARQAAVLAAQGEAAAIVARAEATATGIEIVARAISSPGGSNAVTLKIAEQYVDAFGNIAKTGNTILLPANTGDASSMIAQAMGIYNTLSSSKSQQQTTTSPSSFMSNPNQFQQ